MYVGQMRCTWLPQPRASLCWVPLQGVDNQATAPTSPNPSQRYSRVAPLQSRSGRRPPCRPSCLYYTWERGCLEADWVLAFDMECRHGIYLGCGCSSGPRGPEVETVFLYYTRGLVRWVGGLHCGDMGAMKAETPRNPGYAYTGYCMLAVGYVESGVVGNYEYADGNGFRGVTGDGRLHGGGGTRTTEGPLLLRRMRAALFLGCRFAPDREALAFCLLQCCPLTPGEQTGQHPSPLLMLTLCSCHCPPSLVDRYPRSSGSSVSLWATSGSPGTHGIEPGRNHLLARDAR